MNARKASPNSGMTPSKIAMAAVTTIGIAGLVGALTVIRPAPQLADASGIQSSVIDQSVDQRLLDAYCPARMTLADNAQYGDSAFQTSEGDIASASRYAAFGAVYQSKVSSLAGDDKGELEDKDPTDESAVHVMSGNADDGSALQATQLLESADGNGVASSTASWASQGDLRGLAAVQCVSPSLSHRFLLPATQTGWSQQMVVANATSKATSVTVQAWGTGASGKLRLATSGVIAVNANSESVYDLSAAAGGQDALFVTLSSRETPVSAVVRAVAVNGLTPQGNDYVAPAGDAGTTLGIAGIAGASGVRVLLMGEQAGSATVSWSGANGTTAARTVDLTDQQVAAVDLGAPPDGAAALIVTSDVKVNAAAVVTRSGANGQSDFALLRAGGAAAVAAASLPDQVSGTLSLVNPSADAATVTARGYDADGKLVGSRDIALNAGASASVALNDLGNGTASVRVDDPSGAVAWNLIISRQALDDAQVGAVASIASTPLTPLRAQIRVNPTQGVVR